MAETQPLVESKIDSYGAVGGDVEGPRREREFAFATPGVLPRQQDGDLQRSRDKSVHVTDEVFNTASHFMALMLSILGSTVLIVRASEENQTWKIVSFSIYGACMIALFACSTLHHGLEGHVEMEKALRIADFCAIFPLIAGTYTPLCLVYLHDTGIGWAFFGVVWFLTGCGIALVISTWDRLPKWIPFTMYITMGWMGAFLAIFLFPYFGWPGLTLIALGGIFYTVGGVMYHIEQPNPVPGVFGFHEIWHCMVIAGAASHYALMYLIVLNYAHNTLA